MNFQSLVVEHAVGIYVASTDQIELIVPLIGNKLNSMTQGQSFEARLIRPVFVFLCWCPVVLFK